MKTGTKTCGAPARERMLGPEEEWSESCDITPTQEPSDQDQGHQGYREERNFRNVRNLSFLWNSLTSCWLIPDQVCSTSSMCTSQNSDS